MAEERDNSDALHHLCFGVLAVQLEFLSASQLMDALNLWLKDRRLNLGKILVETQKLSAKQCDAINLLIDEYLRLHEGNLHKTLMSLKVSPELKDELLSCDDPTIALSFGGIEAQKREDTTISVAVPEKVSSRFQKLHPHASGGLGDLYVACDVELDREVVLKEIKPQYARDTECRRRFSLEAQVTGGLEHPGIRRRNPDQ